MYLGPLQRKEEEVGWNRNTLVLEAFTCILIFGIVFALFSRLLCKYHILILHPISSVLLEFKITEFNLLKNAVTLNLILGIL